MTPTCKRCRQQHYNFTPCAQAPAFQKQQERKQVRAEWRAGTEVETQSGSHWRPVRQPGTDPYRSTWTTDFQQPSGLGPIDRAT